MTYLVKALGACKAPIKPDVDAVWAANEIREVDDALYSYYSNRSVAFTILAGPGAAANLTATLTAADIPVGGAASFTDLADAPSSYTGSANKRLAVAGDESGLVAVAPATLPVFRNLSADGTHQLLARDVAGGIYSVLQAAGGIGPLTLTLPAMADVVAYAPWIEESPEFLANGNGTSGWVWVLRNTGEYDITVASGTGFTNFGTAVVPSGKARTFYVNAYNLDPDPTEIELSDVSVADI